MEKPSPAQIEVARKWLADASPGGMGPQDRAAAAGEAWDRVCLHLDPLIGPAGIEALLARTLKVAPAAFPEVAGLAGAASVEGRPADRLRRCLKEQDPAAVTETAVALFATFFALLATFIGHRLTAQILARAVPETGPPASSQRKS